MKKITIIGGLLLLAVFIGLVLRLMFGVGSPAWLLLLTQAVWLALLLFVLGLWQAGRRWPAQAWQVIGVALLAGMVCLPMAMVTGGYISHWLALPQPLEGLVGVTAYWLPPLALVISALLLSAGLHALRGLRGAGAEPAAVQTQVSARRLGWQAALNFTLCGLLLAKVLHSLYWMMVWDNTYDSLDSLLLLIPLAAAPVAGVLLVSLLPGREKLAALYAALALGLMIWVGASGMAVDFRQLTAERAQRVSQAVKAHQARTGSYPHSLRQLVPGYLLALPEPVVIYGQDWCYQGGQDFYRLGYVDREHWSSPDLLGQVFAEQGDTRALGPVCAQEIDAVYASWLR